MQQITKQEKAQRLEKLAWILDSVIPIPGTNWRIGLDGLIGLIPGVGDISAGAISTYILYQALRMGVPTMVVGRMLLNIVMESVVGVIPFFGDIFDFAFKSNKRNVELLREYVDQPDTVKRRSTFTVIITIVGFLLVLGLLVWGMFSLIAALIHAL
ncbi:MAG: DUF4112 domain-containing protein [Thiotrichaceae bacterium]|uniref:DUF4112 domain-containing protein n=1 Tax=Candidatus Thiocaldithrix dubininis TaxID=3080823 RepID=A0AA95H587_9GAMM|nr:MAG: DUF4112 domain-containing protein [Candidatus Thiocaldithrix dubininis]